MNCMEILQKVAYHLHGLDGRVLDILDIKKPLDVEYAQYLAKVVSKISPLVGNMIEYEVVQSLNQEDWEGSGEWKRQDPDFPDAILEGSIAPRPGIEIKTWFPLATEITARFKDSILYFEEDQTSVAVVAWLPEHLIYGKPQVIAIWVGSAKSLALARDRHYHKPPDYLVLEPEDTSARTRNLQQTNTNGYRFQGDKRLLEKARKEIQGWGNNAFAFSPESHYQQKTKSLLGRYPYRLDTNFAKIDRIEHEGLERFKSKVLNLHIHGKKIIQWSRILNKGDSSIEELL